MPGYLRPFVAFTIVTSLAACAAREQPASGFHGTVLTTPQPKRDFTLTSTSGAPFDFRKETDGRLTLLFFGYTYCPDVCPVQMANIAAVLRRLPYEEQQQVRVVFVTTDPERDTPQRLRSWLDNFDREVIGLAGPIATVNAIQQSFGMPQALREPLPGTADSAYGVSHGAAVLAFTPDDSLRVLYPFGVRQQDWAEDIPRLLELGGHRDS